MSTDFDLEALVGRIRNGIIVKKRSYHLQKFDKCFVGKDAVTFMIKSGIAKEREDAVLLGKLMEQAKLLRHVTGDREFEDKEYFYRFTQDEKDHGKPLAKWHDVALKDPEENLVTRVANSESSNEVLVTHTPVLPLDEHNVKLLDNVKPAKWKDPEPAAKYNMVVIGAGAGGLVTAVASAGLGARVAIIEEHLLGGDCLNVGCVPSKALIRCARAAREAMNGGEFGVVADNVRVDFAKVMERMRELRASIAPVDSATRLTQDVGVDVFQGRARFVSKNTIVVNNARLTFAKACIATGGRAVAPPIPGLDNVDYLTNASLFNLTELPKRFGVIGGGPIGSEMAQSFATFGAQVTMYEKGGDILSKEDRDAANVVREWMQKDGVTFKLNANLKNISQIVGADGKKVIRVEYQLGDGPIVVDELDELLVSAGRAPNVQGIGLRVAGIEFDDRKGVRVDDNLRTTNPNVFAVGDCCTKYQFTHVADHMARIVVSGALFRLPGKFSGLLIPWATYTSPEVAHVGAYEHDLDAKGVKYDSYVQHLADVDRAILEGERERAGFVKITCKKGTGKIIGATIVSEHAGSMISEITVAMKHNVNLKKLGNTIHPYPTVAEAIAKCGGQYSKTALTPTIKALFRYLMKKQR